MSAYCTQDFTVNHIYKMPPLICMTFGTFQECFASNLSVDFIFINYTK